MGTSKTQKLSKKARLYRLAGLPGALLVRLTFRIARLLNGVSAGALRLRVEEEYRQITDNSVDVVRHVSEAGEEIVLKFHTPNQICRFRAQTFSTKEPETLRWLDAHPGLQLWDVGANIGLYSIYYAKGCNGRAVAFEPSPFNVGQLAKNIDVNHASDNVIVVPFALSNEDQNQLLRVLDTTEGGALSAFGVPYGFDGAPLGSGLNYPTLGLRGDTVVRNQLCPQPNLIKLDVDGIEHLILAGLEGVLQDRSCLSVLVEINDDFPLQSQSARQILSGSGFKLQEKTHSKMFETSQDFAGTFNQIWTKGAK